MLKYIISHEQIVGENIRLCHQKSIRSSELINLDLFKSMDFYFQFQFINKDHVWCKAYIQYIDFIMVNASRMKSQIFHVDLTSAGLINNL